MNSSNDQLILLLNILKLLAEKPRFKSELIDLLTEYLPKEKRTNENAISLKITRAMQKLRACGFEINGKPNRPYELIESNFPVILSPQQKEALYLGAYLLECMGFHSQAQQIGKIYDFSTKYQPYKIKASFNPPVDYSSDKIRNTINQLENRIKKRHRYTINYCSRSKRTEKIYDLDYSELRLHDGVLYLLAVVTDLKSNRFGEPNNIDQNILFHIDRIKSIGNSSVNPWWNHNFPKLKIIYRMTGALANYQPRRVNEKIITTNSKLKYLDIETTEDYLFWFRQRILKYGKNVHILEPKCIKEEIQMELKEAFQNYSSENLV